MDIRSHEMIERRREDIINGNNNGDDTCNGNNNNNITRVSCISQTLDHHLLHHPQSKSPSAFSISAAKTTVRYRECLKNHAANVGGSVHDGCGEFMPSGEEGTIEALRCAACDCHRNFHRKEIDGVGNSDVIRRHQYNSGGGGGGGRRATPSNMLLNPLMLPPPPNYAAMHHHKYGMSPPGGGMVTPMSVAYGGGGGGGESSSEDLNMYGQSSGEGTAAGQMGFSSSSSMKKRFRTKFTAEQKEKMMDFAEKLGWRMNKQDEEELKRFCNEIGVKRQVFKVWMHNNKNNAKKPSPPMIITTTTTTATL
ncbi:unnamed protein product [Cochlearia groenlandica]